MVIGHVVLGGVGKFIFYHQPFTFGEKKSVNCKIRVAKSHSFPIFYFFDL